MLCPGRGIWCAPFLPYLCSAGNQGGHGQRCLCRETPGALPKGLSSELRSIHHGALSRHVHFVLDEFAAMPLPGFTRELATMRSRNISASTIIQNMAQIDLVEPITMEDGTEVTQQIVPQGPAASQIAIKQAGTNGGGLISRGLHFTF